MGLHCAGREYRQLGAMGSWGLTPAACRRLSPGYTLGQGRATERRSSRTWNRGSGVKYKRVVVQRRGGPDVLQVVEEDLPEPQPGEPRVKILTAGVSALDLMIRARSFPGFARVPFTPGVDIVGVVDKLGEGVSTVEPGQMVAGCPAFDGGGYAEFICRPASELVPVPLGLDPAEAVCLVANYLTAHLALHESARVRSGERILVHGAAGGVGTALLQLGKLAGVEMYGTADRLPYRGLRRAHPQSDRRWCGCRVRSHRRRKATLAFVPSPAQRRAVGVVRRGRDI